MRQIFLDTETTGLEHKLGHRIIEIAGVEMCDRRLTQRHFHRYINPQREIDSGAQAVHGISEEFLADKPTFAEIVAEFLDFIRGAELVIHNAPFDVGFLNAELARLDLPPVDSACQGICDTLRMAKEAHPGKKNNLNALCERYGIDNSQRTLHGALLDAELLADVYLAMTRGQESLIIDLPDDNGQRGETLLTIPGGAPSSRPLRVIAASEQEIDAHLAILASIQEASKGKCLWLNNVKE
ncbi:MAG: DNA polymerase III subunit epsilon [Candidatus Accumulibacter sp.]|nr:DNA polymerase III subunit epsilon [Accumulibacter sp.]